MTGISQVNKSFDLPPAVPKPGDRREISTPPSSNERPIKSGGISSIERPFEFLEEQITSKLRFVGELYNSHKYNEVVNLLEEIFKNYPDYYLTEDGRKQYELLYVDSKIKSQKFDDQSIDSFIAELKKLLSDEKINKLLKYGKELINNRINDLETQKEIMKLADDKGINEAIEKLKEYSNGKKITQESFNKMMMILIAQLHELGKIDEVKKLLNDTNIPDEIRSKISAGIELEEIKKRAFEKLFQQGKDACVNYLQSAKPRMIELYKKTNSEGNPEEDFNKLLGFFKSDRALILSVSIVEKDNEKNEKVDIKYAGFNLSQSQEWVKNIQKILKSIKSPYTKFVYLHPSHEIDGKFDNETAFALLGFISENKRDFLTSSRGNSQNETILLLEVNDKLVQELQKYSKENVQGYRYTVYSRFFASDLAVEMKKKISGLNYENINSAIINYLRNIDPQNKTRYDRLEKILTIDVGDNDANPRTISPEDYNFLISMINSPQIYLAFDPKKVGPIEQLKKSSNATIIIDLETLNPIRPSDIDPENVKVVPDPEIKSESTISTHTQQQTSLIAPLSLFRKILKDQGINIPSSPNTANIFPNYLTKEDIAYLAEKLKVNKPYVHYDLSADELLLEQISEDIKNCREEKIKNVLNKLLQVGMNKGEKEKIVFNNDELIAFKQHISSLSESPYKDKMNLVYWTIRPDVEVGLSEEESKSILEFINKFEDGTEFNIDKLTAHPDVFAPLLNYIKITNHIPVEFGNEWWRVDPPISNAPTLVAEKNQVIALKNLYAKETGLLGTLEDINQQLQKNNLGEKKKQSLIAQRDAINDFLQNYTITPDLYNWLSGKISSGNFVNYIEKIASELNKNLFGINITDNFGFKRSFQDMICVFKNADKIISDMGNDKLNELWKLRGFATLNLTTSEFEGLGLNESQIKTINDIKQAISSVIMFTYKLEDGSFNFDMPNIKMTGHSLFEIIGLNNFLSIFKEYDPNSVVADLKTLCLNLSPNKKSDSLNKLTYEDLLLLKDLAEKIGFPNELMDKLGNCISIIGKNLDENSYSKPLDIKPKDDIYKVLLEYRKELLQSESISFGDTFSSNIKNGLNRSGFFGHYFQMFDPVTFKQIWDKLSEKDRNHPIISAMKAIYDDLQKNWGEVPKQIFAMQVQMRILIPYYIFLGLPISAASDITKALLGRKSLSEISSSLVKVPIAFFLYRYPPLWYMQSIQELKEGNISTFLGMFWAANFFTMMGGYNSIWGRTIQPYTEVVRLLSKIPFIENYVKGLPGIGFEQKIYNKIAKTRVGSLVKVPYYTFINPIGFLYNKAYESNGIASKVVAKLDYSLDWAANRSRHHISDFKKRINLRREANETTKKAAASLRVSASSFTFEQEIFTKSFVENKGDVDKNSNNGVIILIDGDISKVASTGEGSLSANFKLLNLLYDTKNGKSILSQFYDSNDNSLKLVVRDEFGNDVVVKIVEIRLLEGIKDPAVQLRTSEASNIHSEQPAVLYLPIDYDSNEKIKDQLGQLKKSTLKSVDFKTTPDENEIRKSVIDPPHIDDEDRKVWQSLVPKDKNGKPIVELHDNQIQALKALENGKNSFLNIDCGQGKTIIGVLFAKHLRKQGKGIHVMTSNDALVRDWAGEAERMGLVKGKDFAIITSNMSLEEKIEAYKCPIVVGAETLIFDAISGEIPPEIIDAKNKAILVDEADSLLIDKATTPFIVSGGQLELNPVTQKILEGQYEKLWKNSYKNFKKLFLKNGEISKEYIDKEGKLTDKGKEFLKERISKSGSLVEEINRIENIAVAYIIKNDPNSPLSKQYQYKVEGGNIIIINDEGHPMHGMRWEDGMDEAIRLVEGLKIVPPQKILASIVIKGFLEQYERIGGFSGTLIEDWEIIRSYLSDAQLAKLPNYLKEFELTDKSKIDVVKKEIKEYIKQRIQSKENSVEKLIDDPLENIKIINCTGDPNLTKSLIDEIVKEIEGEISPKNGDISERLKRLKSLFVSVDRNPTKFFSDSESKMNAIVDDAISTAKKGRPILVAASTIDEAKKIAQLIEERLNKGEKGKIKIQVLTAENVEQEGQKIIENAGEPYVITVATTAGRGTDIKLGEIETLLDNIKLYDNSKSNGGLHVITTELDSSQRWTTQKVKRSGRQGDRGSSIVYSSPEDYIYSILTEDERRILREAIDNLSREGKTKEAREAIDNLVNIALARHREKALKAIVILNRLYDINKKYLADYKKLYDASMKGLEFVKTFSEVSTEQILKECNLTENSQIINLEQRQQLETIFSKLLGGRTVDLKELQGIDVETAKEVISKKLFEIYSNYFGNDPSFHKNANTPSLNPNVDYWQYKVQEILRKHYAIYMEDIDKALKDFQNSKFVGEKSEAEALRIFEETINTAKQKMMQNIQKELFKYLYRTSNLGRVFNRIKLVVSKEDVEQFKNKPNLDEQKRSGATETDVEKIAAGKNPEGERKSDGAQSGEKVPIEKIESLTPVNDPQKFEMVKMLLDGLKAADAKFLPKDIDEKIGSVKLLTDEDFKKLGIEGDAFYIKEGNIYTIYLRESAVDINNGELTIKGQRRLASAVVHEIFEIYYREKFSDMTEEDRRKNSHVLAEFATSFLFPTEQVEGDGKLTFRQRVKNMSTKIRGLCDSIAKDASRSIDTGGMMGFAMDLLVFNLIPELYNNGFSNIKTKDYWIQSFERAWESAIRGAFFAARDNLIQDYISASIWGTNYSNLELWQKASVIKKINFTGTNLAAMAVSGLLDDAITWAESDVDPLITQYYDQNVKKNKDLMASNNPYLREYYYKMMTVKMLQGSVSNMLFEAPQILLATLKIPFNNEVAQFITRTSAGVGINMASRKAFEATLINWLNEEYLGENGKVKQFSEGKIEYIDGLSNLNMLSQYLFSNPQAIEHISSLSGYISNIIQSKFSSAIASSTVEKLLPQAFSKAISPRAVFATVASAGFAARNGFNNGRTTDDNVKDYTLSFVSSVAGGGGIGLGTGVLTYGFSAAALSIAPIAITAGGIGFLGGVFYQTIDQQNKILEILDDISKNEQNSNKLIGVKNSLRGWISGTINTGGTAITDQREAIDILQKISSKLEVKAFNFNAEDIILLSRLGYKNILGTTINTLDKNKDTTYLGVTLVQGTTEKVVGQEMQNLNLLFGKGAWRKDYTEEEYIDKICPNWRWLVSKQSGERETFQNRLPLVYNSGTVQKFVKMIDSNENLIVRNMMDEYFKDPSLANKYSPDEFWKRTGISPVITKEDMIAENKKFLEEANKFIFEHLPEETREMLVNLNASDTNVIMEAFYNNYFSLSNLSKKKSPAEIAFLRRIGINLDDVNIYTLKSYKKLWDETKQALTNSCALEKALEKFGLKTIEELENSDPQKFATVVGFAIKELAEEKDWQISDQDLISFNFVVVKFLYDIFESQQLIKPNISLKELAGIKDATIAVNQIRNYQNISSELIEILKRKGALVWALKDMGLDSNIDIDSLSDDVFTAVISQAIGLLLSANNKEVKTKNKGLSGFFTTTKYDVKYITPQMAQLLSDDKILAYHRIDQSYYHYNPALGV